MFNLEKLAAKALGFLALIGSILGYLAMRDKRVRDNTIAEVEKENLENTIEVMEKANEIDDEVSNTDTQSKRDELRGDWG